MRTIFNQLIINLDSLVDVEGLLALRPRISALIANNPGYIRPTKYASIYTNNMPGIHDFSEKVKANLDNLENKNDIVDLVNNDALGTYLLFEEEELTAEGSFSFTLLYEDEKNNVIPTDVNQKFDFLYEWLDKQDMFEKYQRIGFFVSWKNTHTFVHTDWNGEGDAWHSLHINFNKSKQLFLVDPESGEKTYLTGHCNWFDTRNWHGTDPVAQSCYSLRVIGKFKPEFLTRIQKLNLK